MPTTDQDARALTYLARRLRTETPGCREWDEAGTWANVAKLQGQQLASVMERVLRHACDPEAKTPGAIHRPFLPAAPGPARATPPKAGRHCETCGREATGACCDKPATRPARADRCPPTAAFLAARGKDQP